MPGEAGWVGAEGGFRSEGESAAVEAENLKWLPPCRSRLADERVVRLLSEKPPQSKSDQHDKKATAGGGTVVALFFGSGRGCADHAIISSSGGQFPP